MEKTAFEKKYYVERFGTNCVKWDGMKTAYGELDLIPLWVADMDFRCPDSVVEAVQKAVNNGAFGYYETPDSYYDAFIAWEKEHRGYEVKREWLVYTPGVVSGLFAMVNACTEPGDTCLTLNPVYPPFFAAVRESGRKLVTSMMNDDHGVYTVDYADFEKKIVENDVKMYIHCSPHNPVGRVWTREELVTLLEICRKHGVLVVSDEIHQDIIMPGQTQIPTATVGDYSDMLVTMTAPSKTFNLAGCQTSFAIIPSDEIRAKFQKVFGSVHLGNGSSFGAIACEAAYTGGAEWLEGCIETIWNNYCYLRDTLAKELPAAVVSPLQGTYLSWVDLKDVFGSGNTAEYTQKRARLAVNIGDGFYGDGENKSHIRINLATSSDLIVEAVDRLIRVAKEVAAE